MYTCKWLQQLHIYNSNVVTARMQRVIHVSVYVYMCVHIVMRTILYLHDNIIPFQSYADWLFFFVINYRIGYFINFLCGISGTTIYFYCLYTSLFYNFIITLKIFKKYNKSNYFLVLRLIF